MRYFTHADLSQILKINYTAIDSLVNNGKIPYKRIVSADGDIIRFSPDAIGRWILNPDLFMDDQKYIERFAKRYENKSPKTLKAIKKFGDQFSEPFVPKRYYLEEYPNKKLGIVYYVRYLDNGKLVPSRWTTRTNNKDIAIKFAIDNREKLLKEFYARAENKNNSTNLYSILKNYYAYNSPYLQIDIKRGRNVKENSRITYHNFIIKQFIPYLRKKGVKTIEEIDTPFMSRFQNYMLADKTIKGKVSQRDKTSNIKSLHKLYKHYI